MTCLLRTLPNSIHNICVLFHVYVCVGKFKGGYFCLRYIMIITVKYVTVSAKRGLSNCMHLTVHRETCEYGINLKFGHLTLLTWLYFWEQFYINRLNTLWVITNWSWKLGKVIRSLFADPVTYVHAQNWK